MEARQNNGVLAQRKEALEEKEKAAAGLLPEGRVRTGSSGRHKNQHHSRKGSGSTEEQILMEEGKARRKQHTPAHVLYLNEKQ